MFKTVLIVTILIVMVSILIAGAESVVMRKRKRKLNDISDSGICDFRKSARLSSPPSAWPFTVVAQKLIIPTDESKQRPMLQKKLQKETSDM